MKLNEAQKIAEEVKGWLTPYCKKIEIAGSIRRQKAEVGDVELLCIPKPSMDLFGAMQGDELGLGIQRLVLGNHLDYRLNSKGSKVYGIRNKLLTHVTSGFPIDIFSTDESVWATAMVVRTGPKESNIRIAMAAKKKGWRFLAYGAGFRKEDGTVIVCTSEREIFEAVGLEYKEPEER